MKNLKDPCDSEKETSEPWSDVVAPRRGGKKIVRTNMTAKTCNISTKQVTPAPSSILTRRRVAPASLNHKCICSSHTNEYFCSSRTCRNDTSKRTRPAIAGSVTVGLVDTDEGSPRSTIRSPSPETPPQPKPRCQQSKVDEDWIKAIPGILSLAKNSTNNEVMDALRKVAEIIADKKSNEYWISDDGQSELLKMIEEKAKPPSSKGKAVVSLSELDYTAESKAMLCSAGPAEQEWYEVELTADTGACDTVIPIKMCQEIPVQPSLQSQRGMEYEVANGEKIPNLGERRCIMWTDNAPAPRHISMQVADVHKGLLSISRCSDMGGREQIWKSCWCIDR